MSCRPFAEREQRQSSLATPGQRHRGLILDEHSGIASSSKADGCVDVGLQGQGSTAGRAAPGMLYALLEAVREPQGATQRTCSPAKAAHAREIGTHLKGFARGV